MISQRWAKDNNRYLSGYYPAQPETYILYLDANNLNGWAMSQPFPYAQFEWVSPEHITEAWVKSLPEDAEVGYIMQVDLIYPPGLHNLYNEHPVAPERVTVTEKMLSPYALSAHQSARSNGSKKYQQIRSEQK